MQREPGRVDRHVSRLRCPQSRRPLHRQGDHLVTEDGRTSYAITETGVPLLAVEPHRPASRIQQTHYDRVANEYVKNLAYPHTEEYAGYIDGLLVRELPDTPLGYVGEICCGRGEAVRLLGRCGRRPVEGIAIDISRNMLESAVGHHRDEDVLFVQGDATMLPLADDIFDNVFVLGGIHHVNDRDALFAEIFRVLKPGGRFYFREPVNDFFLWRLLRAVVYRCSPALDAGTEHPLRRRATMDRLGRAGFERPVWRTCGLLGFCLFMNSDVLVANRVFRHVPGIRRITRAAARIDDWLVRVPGLRHAGLQVVGAARKPARR